jgi:prephenate dehydratase
MRLTQCLLKRKETQKEEMKKIITHPQAIKQCRNTLASAYPELTWDYLSDDYDTAECARNLSLGKYDAHTVVIASEIAAIKYGLDIVERGINDDPENFTSFIFCKRR